MYFRHHPLFTISIEQLLPVWRPDRFFSTLCRDLPLTARTGKRPHVNFVTTRFIRSVSYPTPVWRKRRKELRESCSMERLRFSIPIKPHNHNISGIIGLPLTESNHIAGR